MFKRIDENLLLFSSKFAKQKEYWENKLPGDLTKTHLLLKDRQPDNIPGKKKEKIGIHIPQTLARQVEHLSKNSMLSIYLVLLTTLKVLIDKYIHNRESIIISPVYIHNVSNHTLNKCVFIHDAINENMTFKELLLKVRQSTLEAYENQDYPFNKLIEHLVHWERKPDHRMISNIVCLLENIHDKTVCEDLKEILVFSFGKESHWLYGNIFYDPALCEKVYLEQMGRHFVKILENAIENIDRGLCSIALLSVDEKRQLLFEFNTGSSQYQSSSPIHRLFEEQVTRAPDHIAVIGMVPAAGGAVRDEGQEFPIYITYRELNKRSHQLAQQLREKGVRPDSIVALSVGRSVEMLIGIMGILKASGAYLPLEPDSPKERKQYMLKESGAKILLNRQEIAAISSLKASNIGPKGTSSHLHLPPAPATSLAYVIYTSGTTGKPKGVMLEHRSVVNLAFALNERIYSQYKKGLSIAMLSPYVFDASVKQVFAALLLGHRLYIASTAVRTDAFALLRFYQKLQIEVSDGTPTHIRLLNEVIKENRESLKIPVKHFIIGGEELPRQVVEEFFKGLRTCSGYPGKPGVPTITNVYGPTECCVDTTSYEVSEKTIRVFSHIPLGKPMSNYRVYILGREKELLPIGVAGELSISGTGAARGYLNNPMLTYDKFIDNPFAAGEKIYCSGDIARWMPDGNIAFLGRFDQQVNIRGFRIELEEIESMLFKHEMVKEAVVAAREEVEGDKYLSAYIVPNIHCRGSVDKHELKEYLAGVLPDYMIPAYFMEIERIPLGPNGKIDRKTLPMPEKKSGKNDVAPRDEIEKKLLEIWTEVLDGNAPGSIGIDANFFHLGGHSLNATILAAKIHKAFDFKLKLAQIFKTPTIRELSGYIRVEPGEKKFASIEPGEKKEYYILSSAQKRLYILHQLGMESSVYNIPAIMTLEGETNKRKLEETFKKLIERHESLRTSFGIINEESVQHIHEGVTFEVDDYQVETEVKVKEIIKNFVKPFDLSKAPLLRVGLLNTPILHSSPPPQGRNFADRHLLVVDMHHIISDEISMKIFVKDFAALYGGKQLPSLKLQYKDYSLWQNREKKMEAQLKQAAYWQNQFQVDEQIPALELPTDFSRTGAQNFAGSTVTFEISGEEACGLKSLALHRGTTLYIVLLAVFNVFLSKITGQETIVVGTAVASRRHADLEQIIGMFVNTLALINSPISQMHFNEFLAEVNKNTLEAFENQDYPFEELVEQLPLDRKAGRNPLFDVLFALQDLIVDKIEIPGLKLESCDYKNDTSKFDLMLQAVEEKENLTFTFEYSTKLFKPATIQRFIGYFKRIADVVAKTPTIKLGEIEIISEEKKNQILSRFNDTASEYPQDKLIHQLFDQEVERRPHKAAVVYNNHIITYHALDQLANKLAAQLQERGVKSEALVGIMLNASLEMIVAVLSTLKAGGAYLPIDPGYPLQRIKFMLMDGSTGLMMTSRLYTRWWEEKIDFNTELIYLEDSLLPAGVHNGYENQNYCLSPIIPTRDAHLGYVIYTSGSTGKPKGVMVEHRNVIRLVKNTNFIDFEADDRILQTGALEFDASTFEIWGALLNGFTLYLADKDEILAPGKLKKIISNNQITMMWLTAPLFNQVVQGDIEIFAGLCHLLVGGDVLSPPHINQVRQRFPQLKIINGYGPTENTTFSTTFLIDKEYKESIPIGSPIANSTAYIVDKNEKLQPIGIAGELYVGGDGISRGYLNKPELTVEKFKRAVIRHSSFVISPSDKLSKAANDQCPMTNDRSHPTHSTTPPLHHSPHSPHSPYSPIYRTGDLARWLPGGIIEFLGRIDQQVKSRGFRIELGEIESHLLKHECIKEAKVLAGENDKKDKYLCAYIVSDSQLTAVQLREFLSGSLPGYMIPSFFMMLERIPLTSNGKIDRRQLPMPAVEVDDTYVPPENETHQQIVEIWSDLLAIEKEKISIDANFFELGGHSLKAVLLRAALHKRFNIDISMAEMFKNPTIREIAYIINVFDWTYNPHIDTRKNREEVLL